MKRIVASVGLVALGTSGLQAAPVSSLTSETAKPWSASLTLRGFYDDNINSYPDSPSTISYGGHHYYRSSGGIEITPGLTFSWSPSEQTTVAAGYSYIFKAYDNIPVGNTDSYDQDHTFNVSVDHSFNENYQVSLRDAFVVGQEPDFLRAGNTFSTFTRTPGSNYRNSGSLVLDGQVTPVLGFQLGYANSLYDYANTAYSYAGGFFTPSLAGLLNRQEHAVHFDVKLKVQPETYAVVGYQFSDLDYSGNEPITDPALPTPLTSSARDSVGHYGYVGLDHSFSSSLSGAVRVGARYTDYYNDPTSPTSVDPYAMLSLRWVYATESSVEIGFTHDRAATDVIGNGSTIGNGSSITLDSESSVVYGSVNQRLAQNLYGGLTGSFQNSEYNGGSFDGQSERFYSFGANLEYRVCRNFSTHIGYNYDKLDSGLIGATRSFDRNRVYVGLTASY